MMIPNDSLHPGLPLGQRTSISSYNFRNYGGFLFFPIFSSKSMPHIWNNCLNCLSTAVKNVHKEKRVQLFKYDLFIKVIIVFLCNTYLDLHKLYLKCMFYVLIS